MELEPASTAFEPVADSRPRLWPPPPVHIVAIADVALPALAGLERQLDAFYVELLQFERESDVDAADGQIIYRAENVRLRMTMHERPAPRPDFRPLLLVVPSLPALMLRLNELEIPYVRQTGISPGSDCVVVSDPAGNVVQVSQSVLLI